MGQTLLDVLKWIICWIPHRTSARITQDIVKFRKGNRVKTRAGGGVYWYTPLVDDVQEVYTNEQSIDLPSQAVTTKDGYAVVVSAWILYDVTNAEKFCLRAMDSDQTFKEWCGCEIASYVASWSFADHVKALADKDYGDLPKLMKAILRRYGARLIDVQFSEFVKTRSFRHSGEAHAGVVDDSK